MKNSTNNTIFRANNYQQDYLTTIITKNNIKTTYNNIFTRFRIKTKNSDSFLMGFPIVIWITNSNTVYVISIN